MIRAFMAVASGVALIVVVVVLFNLFGVLRELEVFATRQREIADELRKRRNK